MFHDFSVTKFIFQDFQSPWEPCVISKIFQKNAIAFYLEFKWNDHSCKISTWLPWKFIFDYFLSKKDTGEEISFQDLSTGNTIGKSLLCQKKLLKLCSWPIFS